MRYVVFSLLAIFLSLTPFPLPVSALTTGPSAGMVTKTDSPVIVTGFSFTASRLNYMQLYNSSSEVVDIRGWTAEYMISGGVSMPVPVTLSGLLKPRTYTVIGESLAVPTAPFLFSSTVPLATDTQVISGLRLTAPALYLNHDVATPTINTSTVSVLTSPKTYYWQRNTSTSTGNYLSTFAAFVPGPSFVLLLDPMYEYSTETALQFTEILPNPRNCSPLESELDCSDYVKLYNSSDQVIHLSLFRLRNGYLGQNPSSSNTTALSGDLQPGQFAIVPTNITNTASWVWLEDVYGMYRYNTTVQNYEDASADSKKGQAWAYDEIDGVWKWTTSPQPYDSPSIFPAPPPEPSPVISTPVPCKENQYRSEETNRCRTVEITTSLTPCQDGQYRSEETNRCRSVVGAISSLVACSEEQERNPLTNRCRTIASKANSLVPCNENQERNAQTNRCRNIVKSVPSAAFAIEPVKEGGKAFVGWWALGGVGVLAGGYGVWEWRREMAGAIRKVATFFASSK